jgi:PHP family Zn ribbon phosphoesterase
LCPENFLGASLGLAFFCTRFCAFGAFCGKIPPVLHAVDLHLHSHFSRAVSPENTLPNLLRWAQLKGLDLLSTADCLHGPWLRELETHLAPAPDGLLHPSAELLAASRENLPLRLHRPVRFLLGTEVSCEVRSLDDAGGIHVLIYLPDFTAVHRLRALLAPVADLDGELQGRPPVLLSARDLVAHVLDVGGHLVPAHIWNAYVALLNGRGGYDHVTDAFRDLTPALLAVEAALPTTPAHNRRLSQLDRFRILANSDAHSLPNLLRECNLFAGELTYNNLFAALRRPASPTPAVATSSSEVATSAAQPPLRFIGTEEFPVVFARYWLNWCNHCADSFDAPAHDPCPVCRRPLACGARDRLEQLADRARPAATLPCRERLPLIPLLTTLARRAEPNPAIYQLYRDLVHALGPERVILNETPPDTLARASFPALAEAIAAQRAGKLDFAALRAASREKTSPAEVPARTQLDLFFA